MLAACAGRGRGGRGRAISDDTEAQGHRGSGSRGTQEFRLTPAPLPDTFLRMDLLKDFEAGKRPALARAISIVENQRTGFLDLLNRLYPRIGRAHRIGITGPPGAGKSTLTAALIAHYRSRGETIGVIAVDPTSPFTGGALL